MTARNYLESINVFNFQHKKSYEEMIPLMDDFAKAIRESNCEYSQKEIEQLQNEVHKITGDGEVMELFNSLLGIKAN